MCGAKVEFLARPGADLVFHDGYLVKLDGDQHSAFDLFTTSVREAPQDSKHALAGIYAGVRAENVTRNLGCIVADHCLSSPYALPGASGLSADAFAMACCLQNAS